MLEHHGKCEGGISLKGAQLTHIGVVAEDRQWGSSHSGSGP